MKRDFPKEIEEPSAMNWLRQLTKPQTKQGTKCVGIRFGSMQGETTRCPQRITPKEHKKNLLYIPWIQGHSEAALSGLARPLLF